MHPDIEYRVRALQRRELMAMAARSRLAAECGAARPSGRGGEHTRLTRALIRVAALAWSSGRARRPVPQS
jgi:hypothetical protein